MDAASADYAGELSLALLVTAPAVRAAIADFVTPGSCGLDIGCGQGQHSLWLAEAAGTGARVTGLDPSRAHLDAARRLADGDPGGGRVDFVEGELESLPFGDGVFDWVWCADTFWPGLTTADPVRSLAELTRVLRPGGRLGLIYWSSQLLLPGYPLLEARLDAAFAPTVPYLANVPPEQHFLCAAGWLRDAGIAAVKAQTYLAELRGPLAAPQREGLEYCLRMLWGGLESAVAPEDWRAFQDITSRASDRCVLARDDYYGFVTYTLFSGVKPS